jgi:hypothetical protein
VHGHREDILGDFAVHLEDVEGFLLRFLGGRVEGVALLPEELGGAQERTRHLLPAQDVAPLVEQHRQVAPRLDPLRVHRADHGLGRRADRERLFELFTAADGHPGALGREAFDVLLLALEEALRNEEREVGVLVPERLDAAIGLGLKQLPDRVTVGADHHAALDRAVVGKLGLEDDVEVPLRVVDGRRGDFFEGAFFHGFFRASLT